MQGKFNQYNITTELAKKYSRSTYLASPTHTQRAHSEPDHQVVLTVFSASLFHFPYERENLLEKAQRIKQFQHPHLLPILDMGIEEEQPFAVREYLPDDSLRSHLKKISPRRLKLRDALTIVSQVGDALAYAHEHNIIHGNLKPENILLDANGQAILVDFSLVGRKDAIIRDQTSGEYAFCYMAPEQFVGINDARSDQYALGCLAYELITGRVPFAAQTLTSMMGQPNNALPAPLSESVGDLPPSLEVAVLKTLAKDPDERFFDFSLFLEVIRSVLSPPPAFPLLRSANSRKNRIISHPVPSIKAEIVSSSIRKDPAKRLAPQSLEPSEAVSSAEHNMAEPIVAPAISASIPGQAGTALLEVISLSEIFTDEQAMTIHAMKQEGDNLLFIDEEVDELPARAPTSSAQNKDTTNTKTHPSTKSTLARGLPSTRTVCTRYGRRTLIGLVLLILVIGASSTYAIFSPFSTIQPDLLRHPVQVVKQGGIIPQIPLQGGPDIANGQNSGTNNPTANGQNSGTNNPTANGQQNATQSKSISTEQSPSQITSQGSSSSSSPSSSTSSPSSSTSSPSSSTSSPSSSTSSPSSSTSSPSSSTSSPSSSTSSPSSSTSSSPPPSSSSSSQPSTATTNMTIYFSGWTDNSPPGAGIAYPQIHQTAGGTGTYSDPITFAASQNALSPGTIIYVSFLKKYFIMEDDCSDCDSAWNNNHSYEISLWTGGDANSSQSAQQSCENSLTPSSPQAVEVKPASNLTIDTTPLFTDSGGCIKL